ncbi:tetratricopeptide repeat protein [Formosa sp. S-31]|uniref:tetratricopeptide repeat protein n=1 Tax=Formosa sp. S-31 TaxID=2790949 RepID=UPI003EBCC3D8
MKSKVTLLVALLCLGLNSFAQNEAECGTKLSIFHEYVKAKNYDAAYEPWMFVRTTCPKFNNAIHIDGEKILKHKIDNSTGAEQAGYINDLMKLWDEKLVNFPAKAKQGEVLADKAQLMYDYRKELGLSDLEVYNAFDEAFTKDKANFKNPKGLYTYFSLMVDLYDADQKSAQDLFNKYDDVVEKVDEEVANYSEDLNELIEKEEAGTALTSKEEKYKKYYSSYLDAYDKIGGSINSKLGERANCENLIPLYTKDFEAHKTDAVWLQRAAAKMSEKECTSDPLFFKLVNAYHDLNPSANSAYYLGILKDKEGKSNEALKYYEQALSLETDDYKKAKLYSRIGDKLKGKGNYPKARTYYREALKLNPSNGRPHLQIASMYAASANNCGDSAFNKRAVFWLAADEAAKAGRVDPTLKSHAAQSAASYKAKAPQKSDIFAEGNAGSKISIGCWIGSSVTVPSI